MKMKCVDCLNSNCFLKNSHSQEKISELKDVYTLKSGQFIFKEHNPFDGIYIILSGKVKVFSSGYKGRVQIIRLAKDGFVLGHRGLGKKYYTISAVTIEETTVCFIENDVFYEALKRDNDLTYRLMLFYAEELRNAENRMKTLAQMTVKEKVSEALLLAAKTFGERLAENELLIRAKLSRNDIAEIAGVRTEQFIRELSELKKEGIVMINDTKHILIKDVHFLKMLISPYYIESEDIL